MTATRSQRINSPRRDLGSQIFSDSRVRLWDHGPFRPVGRGQPESGQTDVIRLEGKSIPRRFLRRSDFEIT